MEKECKDIKFYEDKVKSLGFETRLGYHAWFIGCGAGGHKSALDFINELNKSCLSKSSLLNELKKLKNYQDQALWVQQLEIDLLFS